MSTSLKRFNKDNEAEASESKCEHKKKQETTKANQAKTKANTSETKAKTQANAKYTKAKTSKHENNTKPAQPDTSKHKQKQSQSLGVAGSRRGLPTCKFEADIGASKISHRNC